MENAYHYRILPFEMVTASVVGLLVLGWGFSRPPFARALLGQLCEW